jgi:hypothetical protein
MVGPEGFTLVDGTVDIEEQQRNVRQKVIEVLRLRKNISPGVLNQ